MEDAPESVKMIALDSNVDEFVSCWGSVCKPQYNEGLGKWLLPLGWESELNERGISFEVVEVILSDES